MTALNIISGILLFLASIAIIFVVMVTDTRHSGINSAITGGSDTFFGRNAANTKEAKLDKLAKICVTIFFVVTIIVNIVTAYLG